MLTSKEAWASKYIGVPFLAGGRTLKGLDCYGLLHVVFKEQLGVDIPEHQDVYYERNPSEDGHDRQTVGDAISMRTLKDWTPIIDGQEKSMDGIILRIAGHPIHIGLVLVPGIMLHSEFGHDTVVESYRNLKWERRLVGFYRHKSLIGGTVAAGNP
jgi:cell wall-associated NlpC family hydrolase